MSGPNSPSHPIIPNPSHHRRACLLSECSYSKNAPSELSLICMVPIPHCCTSTTLCTYLPTYITFRIVSQLSCLAGPFSFAWSRYFIPVFSWFVECLILQSRLCLILIFRNEPSLFKITKTTTRSPRYSVNI
jgi:hypothetical protein